MNDVITPNMRLRAFFQKIGKKASDLSVELGRESSYFSKYLSSSEHIITKHEVLEFLSKYGLNVDWYIKGEGNMLDEIYCNEHLQPYYSLSAGMVRTRNEQLVEEKVATVLNYNIPERDKFVLLVEYINGFIK
ncbi:MAG: hypothetical protein KIT33_15640 [Candidatus Kapabacteria bacterium]|nr:hypothetical protein [Ignavibacteriota bacterium]MCW5886403.1 hypothetical protein [Candidatus Kapabacteria bacterium]